MKKRHIRSVVTLSIILFVCVLAAASVTQATWMSDTVVSGKTFSLSYDNSIALDSSGNPHIVFGEDHLYHAYFDGNLWHTEIIDPSSRCGDPASIGIDANDKIHILYALSITGWDEDYSYYRYATNKSGTWTFEDLDFLKGDAEDIADAYIAVSDTGTPHIIFRKQRQDAYVYDLYHATKVSGTWITELVDQNIIVEDDIYVDHAGHVHISYQSGNHVKHASDSSGAMQTDVVAEIAPEHYVLSNYPIAVGSDGIIHIAFGDGKSGNVYCASGTPGNWIVETIENVGDVNKPGLMSLGVDTAGQVHIAYMRRNMEEGNHTLRYAQGSAGAWTIETVDPAVVANSNYGPSLAVDASGLTHICYWDDHAVQYARGLSGSWALETVDSDNSRPGNPSADVDSSGRIQILYRDSYKSPYLFHVTGSYRSWMTEGVSGMLPSEFMGSWVSMGLDSSDHIHAAARHGYGDVLLYLSNNSGAWSKETVAPPDVAERDALSYPEIGVAPDDSIHLFVVNFKSAPSVAERKTEGLHIFKAGGLWQDDIALAETSNWQFFTANVIDHAGYIHMAWQLYDDESSSYALYYSTNMSGQWIESKIMTNYQDIESVKLAVDLTDTPYICYSGKDADGKATLECRYRNGSDTWSPSTLLTAPQADSNIFLHQAAGGTDGQIHLLFRYDGTLRHAVGSMSSWSIDTVTRRNVDNPGYANIAVDQQNNVHILYRDDNYDIRYATNAPIEESGPDGSDPSYDGNGDGTPDSQQDNVVSLHTYDNAHYLTISSPEETSIENVETTDNPSPINTPEGIDFPYGFVNFTATCLDQGGSLVVTLTLEEGTTINTYYKYGPTPDNQQPHWYEFLYDGATGAVISGNMVTLYFVDGQRGDHDLTANGVIVDPGAPAFAGIPGDLDGDGDVDRDDVNIVMSHRNQAAEVCTECDIDGDGTITVLDARKLILQCTRPRCATSGPE